MTTPDLTLILAHPLSLVSLVVFGLGLMAGVFFFVDWLAGRPAHMFLLPWAFGMLVLQWLQLPSIVASSGSLVYVNEINTFIAFAFPLSFIGLVLLYAGMVSIAPPRHRHTYDAVIITEIAVALLVYLYALAVSSDAQNNLVLVIVTNLMFFLPMRLLIFLTSWQWYRKVHQRVRLGRIGLLLIMGWALAGALNHTLVLPRLFAYPQQFWFVAYTNYHLIYFIESVSVPMLVLGLLFLRFSYAQIAPPLRKKSVVR